MKSFFLPVGHAAGTSLSTLLAAFSCGAALPVSGLDILYVADQETDPVLQPMVRDLNLAHETLKHPDNVSLFPSSFTFDSCRPRLPESRELSDVPAAGALLGALRGKGIPLSYKTDREAVEWAFSSLLSGPDNGSISPFLSWIRRISDCLERREDVRVSVLCDLCDPWSAGIAFPVLRFLHETISLPPSCAALFCLGIPDAGAPDLSASAFSSSIHALLDQALVSGPDESGTACAGAAWLLALPSSLVSTKESFRLLYAVLARQLAVFLSSEKVPAPGLHTVSIPGILTFHSLGSQGKSFAYFLHAASWLICDLFPALSSCIDHPASFRSLSPNTRNGLFRRLFHGVPASPAQQETVSVLRRAVSAVLAEVLSLIRYLPEKVRLAEVSDPLWHSLVDACGRTVTVVSEYDVSVAEAREGGILEVKPVHRVSMADTEEEKLERRLEDIAAQLKEEEEARGHLFDSAGSCWAVLALQDCRSRCLDALNRAKSQLEHMSPDPDRLSVAAVSRRIRLLDTAVARCDRDMAELKKKAFGAAFSRNNDLPEADSSFANQLVDAVAASRLLSLLTITGEEADPVRKEIQSLLPSLLFGFRLSDARTLLRQLIAACKPGTDEDPVRSLLLAVLSVSCDEIRPLRFISSGDLPAVPLLPDLYPDGYTLTFGALLPLLPDSSAQSSGFCSVRRGLLAMLLLRQYRRRASEEASLSFEQYTADDSPVLHAWLSAKRSDCVWILSLGTGELRLPMALILPGRDLIPARFTASHTALLPAFCISWFDEDNLSFRDPCGLLGEGDLSVLLEILPRMVRDGKEVSDDALIRFLEDFRRDLACSAEQVPLPGRLGLRLKAAFGLRLLPAFQHTLVRTTCAYERFLSSDDVAARLVNRSSFAAASCSVPDDIIYLYRDVPFARESSRTLLQAIPLQAENWILNLLEEEARILCSASDDYHDALSRELDRLLLRYPDAIPEAGAVAQEVLEEARRPVTDTDTELAWPWDPASPSVLTILFECLGEPLAAVAVRPFSDMLTLFPARGNEVIGDTLVASMCLLPAVPAGTDSGEVPAVLPDAVLPPLSGALCAALCSLPEGRTLLRPDLLSFERGENQSVRVTIMFDGAFPLRLTRDYTEDEILHLYSHDIPTLAVWPDLPLPREDWHAYYIYASLPSSLRITACSTDGETISPGPEEQRAVLRSTSFPLSFSLSREDRSIGSLPNLLPAPVIEKSEPYTACVDFGSAGTSVVFSVGHRRHPMQGPSMVRTLLNNPSVSRDLLRREFLPAVPVSALLPTAVRIFRNTPGAKPLPFEDGIVLMSSDLRDVLSVPAGSLYTCLKWEEEKGRSVVLCLHQVMLMTALQARSEGASALFWRFSLPDDMAREGRERLISLFSDLADQVCRESGFSLPEKQPLITFAAESSALGAYFRLCASEDTRGGFMVMDIGACTADISLFLRGREQAVRACQVPLGIHYMLLPELLRDPDLPGKDLGFVQDPSFIQDLTLLQQILQRAKSDPSSLRHSRLALDSFIADRFPVLVPSLLLNPLSCMPTRIGSVLLLHLSFLMMNAGLILLQIAADPGKNDFLPEQMSLCLSGRGALLAEYLPDQYKTALWHFLTMFRNRRVASLSFLFSSEKKMEIPVGLSVLQDVSADLPPSSSVPAAISVRPEELLPRFLLQFAKEFPASAELLFHGFFTGDFYHPFTPYGESVVAEAISRSFTEQTAIRPYDALSAWIGSLLELIGNSAV